MQSRTVLLLCGLLAGCVAALCEQEKLAVTSLTGYVTRAASASDFDVNGFHVLCSEKTRNVAYTAYGVTKAAADCPGDLPYVGEGFVVYYTVKETNSDTGTGSVYATGIESQRTPSPGEVSGSAVIDAAPVQEATTAQTSGLLIRADGYKIRITGETKIEWNAPVQSLADVKAGHWIKYKGKPDAAGVVAAASVEIGPNAIGSGEEKLRSGKEYDPSAVPASARQSFLKDGFKGGCKGSYVWGCDPKKFPPSKDAEMQVRIEKIGNSLVPAYQRALPDSDPAKIDFRFQLIDTKHFRDALALPSGIILLPHQVAERMRNDSQLATVLADAIACALERQQYRTEGKVEVAYASGLASAFVPYGGFGMSAGSYVAEEIEKRTMEQRGRVSLTLLHDAGYDIDQAPVAWWLLAPEKPQPLFEIEMPERAAYLYRILGETWHNPAASATQAP